MSLITTRTTGEQHLINVQCHCESGGPEIGATCSMEALKLVFVPESIYSLYDSLMGQQELFQLM